MSKQSELGVAREAMQDHLQRSYSLHNGVYTRDNIKLFAWSQWKNAREQLEITLQPNTAQLDTDWQNLATTFRGLVRKVVEVNHEKQVPAFVFLHTRTDYSQKPLEQRVTSPVNRIGGNKQLLGTQYQHNPFNDIRKLDRHEIAVWGLLHHAGLQEKHIKYKGNYLSELVHYHAGNDSLQRSVYKNIEEHAYRRMNTCPECANTKSNHRDCKSEWSYKKAAIQRNTLRYHKWVHIADRDVTAVPKVATLDRTVLEKWSPVPLRQQNYSVGVFS